MPSEITQAIKNICEEKGIPYESVLETVKAALAAAYRKDFGNKLQNIQVEFDPETVKLEAYDVKTVVEDVPEEELEKEGEEISETPKEEKPKKEKKPKKKDAPEAEEKVLEKAVSAPEPSLAQEGVEGELEKKRFNPKTEIQISEAKKLKKSYKIGDVIRTKLEVPGDFGRMAAQTAKQVIIQKLREAEREIILNEFKSREDMVVVGVVQRREGKLVLVDLGRATAIMPPEHQIPREAYIPGDHLKVYVVSVNKTTKGPEIIVSRSHENIVKKFFEMEIPEIASGVVEIKGIAREPGSRTKIAVFTEHENIDPIGSCIGQRGARVQTIISELKGEKIDIIEYSEDAEKYINNSLSPAKISHITLDGESKTATVAVTDDQLSLAIGKAGQNVRLAARLTGWRIDIVTDSGKKVEEETKEEVADAKDEDGGKEEKEKEKESEIKTEAPKPEDASAEDAKKEESPKKEKKVKEKKAKADEK